MAGTSKEEYRILLISSSEAMRSEIENALASMGDEYRLYWVSHPDLVLSRVQDLLPHAVIADEAIAGSNIIKLISQLSSRFQGMPVLALIEEEAIDTARQAVLAGAKGFFCKPLNPGQFSTTLRQILSRRKEYLEIPESPEAKPGKVIVFCAPKGGTGRTTLALNLAISLTSEKRGNSTVLVDADYAAPALDVIMNLHSELNVMDLVPRLSRLDAELLSGILANHSSGVRVLLAPPPGDFQETFSLPQVQIILAQLKQVFQWIVVDLGLPLDEKAFAFLDGADKIIVTVLPEMVGLRNTRLMLQQLSERGFPDDKLWLILNRSTMKGGVSAGDIEKHLHIGVKYSVPDDQPLVTYSINRGVPLMISHPQSAVARSINKLAQIISDDMSEEKKTSGGQILDSWSPLMRRILNSKQHEAKTTGIKP